jgi:hypothetical protein
MAHREFLQWAINRRRFIIFNLRFCAEAIGDLGGRRSEWASIAQNGGKANARRAYLI